MFEAVAEFKRRFAERPLREIAYMVGGYILIDIRTLPEYNAGHIVEATSVPLATLGYRAYSLDKTKDVIAYCNTGVTSKIACQILINAGFKDVYNLTGGLQVWPYGLEPTDGRINV